MPDRVTIFDYSDRELLLIMLELPTQDGYVSTLQLADALGLSAKNRLQSVGSRMAGMRRLGIIEKDPDSKDGSRWQPSHMGRLMAQGNLTAGARRALENIRPEHYIEVTRYITRAYSSSDGAASHMIRREWAHGTKRS